MIVLLGRDEREMVRRLRDLTPASEHLIQIETLKRQIADLEIAKSKIDEKHAREDRELRHMIGLEKKRQEVEMAQAKRDTELTVREGNLTAEKARFAEQLRFNTERFEKMEQYQKDMLTEILQRLPNVTMEIKRKE